MMKRITTLTKNICAISRSTKHFPAVLAGSIGLRFSCYLFSRLTCISEAQESRKKIQFLAIKHNGNVHSEVNIIRLRILGFFPGFTNDVIAIK